MANFFTCFLCTVLFIVHHDANHLCREALISYITSGDDIQVTGSLSVRDTLLQTKGYIADIQIS